MAITRTAWTDDDGTGTTGTVLNNAVKTELYDQIDAALALLLPKTGGALSGPLTSDLLFTDATYDIGKSGATRPRDAFFSRNVTIGGAAAISGNVGLNVTSSPWDATYRAVDIQPGGGAFAGTTGEVLFSNNLYYDGAWRYKATGAAALLDVAGQTFDWYRIASGSAGATATLVHVMGVSNTGVLKVDALASGTLTSASGVITSSSDECLKDVLGPLEYGLKEVRQLRPIRYRWNARSGIPTEPEYGGFGAAQVEPILPLAVAYDAQGVRSLSDRPILGALVHAVQELAARLDSLEGHAHG